MPTTVLATEDVDKSLFDKKSFSYNMMLLPNRKLLRVSFSDAPFLKVVYHH